MTGASLKRALRAMPLLLAFPVMLPAQSLVLRAAALGDGILHLSFAGRPGVCGNGSRGITIVDNDDEWEGDCERGPVRVSLTVRSGKVTRAHTYVGGRWRSAIAALDLGVLPAARAATELLALAERGSGDGGDLICAATLADSVVIWPALIRLAHDPSVRGETRRQAIFWLGQAAGDAATRGLDSIVAGGEGVELKKQAVFALSQRPEDEGVPVLIRIARTNRYAEIRKSALFWLGQSEDPRVLALFEELLR